MDVVTRKDAFNNVNNDGLKGKVVRNMTIAKRLLDRISQEPTNEIRVIGIKADRSDPEHKRSVVIFEDNDRFQEVFSEVLEENKRTRESRTDTAEVEDLKNQVEELKKLVADMANKEG